MDYSLDYSSQRIAAEASADACATFIRRTYGHLAGAILAFAILETLLVQLVPANVIRDLFFNRAGMLIELVAFVGVAWLANKWALSGASPAKQYAGLALYVVAEAVIFLPLMFIAANFAPDVLPKAGIMTLAMFAGLTVACFITKQPIFPSCVRSWSSAAVLALGFIVVAMTWALTWATGFRLPWSPSRAGSSSMIHRTSCIAIAPISMWRLRWLCLPRSRCSSGTSCQIFLSSRRN